MSAKMTQAQTDYERLREIRDRFDRRGYRVLSESEIAYLLECAERAAPADEQCTYCGEWYAKPVSYHHSEAECAANLGVGSGKDTG